MTAPYLTAQVPAPGATGVLVDVSPTVTVTDDTHNIIKTSVNVYLILATGSIHVYNGSTDTFHADFPGTIVAAGDGRGWVVTFNPDTNLYETYVYGTRVTAEDTSTATIDETYEWDTETLRRIPNSGFEAPGSLPGEARGWDAAGEDPSGQMGTKRGRVQNPAIWTPPEGEFVLALGSIDITEAMPDAMSQAFTTPDVDLTTYLTLKASYKIALDATQPAGVTYAMRVLIDETPVWTKTFDDTDAGHVESGTISVDISGYSGVHDIHIAYSRMIGDWGAFDLGLSLSEQFAWWGGEMWYLTAWDDDLAELAYFEDFTTGW